MYSALKIKLPFIILLFCLTASAAFADDAFQERARERLKKEIEVSISQKNPAPIQTVLKRYQVRGAIGFSGVANESDSLQIAQFLPKTRPAKVSLREWQALKNSDFTIEPGENESCEFTLLDLDEDGLRDLIVHSYIGGTGLFSYVFVYRQSGGRFVIAQSSASSEELRTGQFYSISGRGADQEADWVRIDGRVYLAYRNGEYGQDQLLLLRAFPAPAEKNKGLIVEYEYQHTLPPLQKLNQQIKQQKGKILEADLYAALQKGLRRIPAQTSSEVEIEYGSCPVPKNLTAEEKEQYAWSWFKEQHYTFDTVADFPVFVGNECFAARLVSFKNSYREGSSFYLSTGLWLLRRPENEREELDVISARSALRVRIADIDYPFEEN